MSRRSRGVSALGRHTLGPGCHPDDRAILTLALPALGALAADPLYSLVDTAFVGHLGAPSLTLPGRYSGRGAEP